MPFYTFKCPECKREKEILQKIDDKPPITVTLWQPPYENENILYKTKWNEKDVIITEIKTKFEDEE